MNNLTSTHLCNCQDQWEIRTGVKSNVISVRCVGELWMLHGMAGLLAGKSCSWQYGGIDVDLTGYERLQCQCQHVCM